MSALVAASVLEIDTLLGGWERVTAGYLMMGKAPVLVETGSQTSAPAVLASLTEQGLSPEDLAGIAVSHIHLDHAGGVGDLAAAFPKAVVYVHPRGARHLVDPARLIASAATVYGDALDQLYGRMRPVPADRVKAMEDGEAIDLGEGRRLTAVHSPGHAKHHMALHDSESGLLFVGDAVGVRLPDAGVLRPATPPADFDLSQALNSLAHFSQRSPAALVLAHYGLLPRAPDEELSEAADALREWAGIAQAAWRAGNDIEEALRRRFEPEILALPDEQRRRVEALNGIHSNAEGLRQWLARVDEHVEPHQD